MDDFGYMIASLIFLGIAYWLLNQNKYARYIMRPMNKLLWALTKKLFGYVGKLLRKVVSRFDPY